MKNNSCFVDTSALLALNNPKDQYHETASEIASKLKNIELVISDTVLTETYTLLRYRLGFHTVDYFLKTVLAGSPFMIAEVTLATRTTALQILEQFHDQKSSYCDAVAVAIMREQNINQIFAFDHHFDMMGVTVIR